MDSNPFYLPVAYKTNIARQLCVSFYRIIYEKMFELG